jgi:hypothetical protein
VRVQVALTVIAVTATLTGCGSGGGIDPNAVGPVAAVMAHDDHNAAAVGAYAKALTTLAGRCTQSPLDISTVDVLTAQILMKEAGDVESGLAILQAMVKASDGLPSDGKQNCEEIAKALTAGVQQGQPLG